MKSLFWHKAPYDIKNTEKQFVEEMRENMRFQFENCKEYRELLEHRGWNEERIGKMESVAEIPFIPTLFFKHHRMDSVPKNKLLTTATSSGTSGTTSAIGYDVPSLLKGLGMVLSVGKKHKLWSLRPCHYIILGYEARNVLGRKNDIEEKAVAKTAYGFTFFAPALSRTYALPYVNGEYKLDLETIKKKLVEYSKGKTPVRIIGFPFHAYWLLSRMKEEGTKCPLPKGSLISFGGGWKQYYTERADKQEMYDLVEEILDIKEAMCREFFGAVEHPILYCDCPKHHFHVPIYSRVLIRDVETYEPLPNGEVGLVNLLTPMVGSAPILSVMTDDLGILHDGAECGCGIDTPYLEILGRVGMEDITTCAAGAENLMKTILGEN